MSEEKELSVSEQKEQKKLELANRHEALEQELGRLVDPKSVNDLTRALRLEGQKWRNEHTKINGQTLEVKVPPVTPRACADILKKYLVFALIGNTDKALEHAPLTFWRLDTGIYTHSNKMLREYINQVENTISKPRADTVIYYLTVEAPDRVLETRPYLQPVGNGIVNLKTDELIPYGPSYVFTSKIATNYNPNAKEPKFRDWSFSKWINDDIAEGDKDKITMFWQCVSCILTPNDNKKASLLLVDDGKGNTGKSTMQQLFINLVGKEHLASLKIKEFQEDFKLANAYGASLIIGDDNNPADFIADSSNYKSVVAGEEMLFNPKGEAPFTAKLMAFVAQSMNGIPRFKDNSDANYNRFRVLYFHKHYGDKELNPNVKSKYVKDRRLLEWVLYKGLHVKPFRTVVKTKESNQILKGIQIDNDPVLGFVENYLDEFYSTRIPIKALFKTFMAVCDDENNHQQIKQQTFTRRIKPFMEKHGWHYDRRNKAPLESWHDKDRDLISRYNGNIRYDYSINPNTTQGLFYKD